MSRWSKLKSKLSNTEEEIQDLISTARELLEEAKVLNGGVGPSTADLGWMVKFSNKMDDYMDMMPGSPVSSPKFI